MSVSNDEPQANTPQSARQPEVSDEMVEAACAAFEQAQQWLVASARAYPVREVMRRALEAALAVRCKQDEPSGGEDSSGR
jgi:predicted secreted protein